MGQSCSSSKQEERVSSSSQLIIVDSLSPSSNHETNSSITMKPSKRTKRVVAAKSVKGCIGSVIHKLRLVTYEEDCQSSSTVTIQSSSTDSNDGQISMVVVDRQIPPHHNEFSPSPSSPQSRKSSYQNDKLSINQTYQILPQITGRGIAGQVRHCIHRPTSQLCAVKTITKKRIRRKDWIHREVAILKQVDHPNIISLHDVYEDKKEVHIVTELCRGGELFDKIVEKATLSKISRSGEQVVPSCFREKDAARIIYSLLSAVSYLHSKDIVHRDIKPENILFTEKDNDESPIKLIDFGLSTRHSHQCKPLTTTVGTSYYMAPELLEGSYDRSCDMWSIGVIAYVMLSGRPPFNGPSNDIIFKQIQRGQYKMEDSSLWDGVSEYAKEFIRCFLDMDPRTRWTADMALEHPWLKMERSLDAESDSRPTRTKRTRSC
mmetsp:Transcript_38066/g.68589  ORF Transcript_38066/g.68589 Transcript_38066/m.68589 type:complete len:433 (+) Transcript_38066:69-1367(+)